LRVVPSARELERCLCSCTLGVCSFLAQALRGRFPLLGSRRSHRRLESGGVHFARRRGPLLSRLYLGCGECVGTFSHDTGAGYLGVSLPQPHSPAFFDRSLYGSSLPQRRSRLGLGHSLTQPNVRPLGRARPLLV
jgi:hypothetical protein